MQIIPKYIIEEAKQIRKALDDHKVIGVISTRRRQYGVTLIKQLLQTEDIEHEIVEPKRLTNDSTSKNR